MKFIHKYRHSLLMVICCVAMMIALFALATAAGGGNRGVYLLILLCPAMHLLMHRGMHSGSNRHETPLAELSASEKENESCCG